MIEIFTDTSANLTVKLIKKHNLHLLPFNLNVNDQPVEYPAEQDFNGEEFYDAMRKGAVVSTSLINVGAFEDAFRPVLAAGNDIIYIGMSGGISGTANAARIAAEELREEFPERRIETIDTYAASLGEGLQVLHAAGMAQKGASMDDLIAYLNKSRNTMCQYFMVDDLEYLRRGGRISGASAVIGNILNIKPILTGNAIGQIVLNSKVRGIKMAMKALADKFDKLCADKNATIGIAHANNKEGADYLLSLLRQRGFIGECVTVMYEAVTGSHVGPGTVALFYDGITK